MPQKPTAVPASAWVGNALRGRDVDVIEHAYPISRDGAVLSLVIMPDLGA